jgi:hypothetical protein
MPKRSRRPNLPELDLSETLFDLDESSPGSADKEASPQEPGTEEVKLRNVVKFELLDQVSGPLLERFLRRFQDRVESKGICLAEFSTDQAWLLKLHDVLRRVDLDPELQQALVDLGEMSSLEGHDHLLRATRQHQEELFAPNRHLSRFDMAFLFYLEYSGLFRISQSSFRATQAERYVVYCARNDSPLANFSPEGTHVRAMKKVLSRYFASRNRTGYCDIQVSESEQDVHFVIIHGHPPQSYSVIVDQRTRSRVSHVQAVQDSVIFSKATCRLSIHARGAHEQEVYRSLFGFTFFRSRDHFLARPIVTGDPLLTLGSQALSVSGFPWLRQVKLRHIQVGVDNGRGTRIALDDPDLAELFENPVVQLILRHGGIRTLQMDALLYGYKRVATIVLTPPNHFKHDPRVAPDQIRSFLIQRGFLSLTPLMPTTHAPGVH